MLDNGKNAQAQKYELEAQYQAVKNADKTAKAQPMAVFTAAALRRMVVEDVAENQLAVNEVFELTKAVRAEADLKKGTGADALPEQLNPSPKGKDPIVESMLQNPALQQAALGDDQAKLQTSLEAAKMVAQDTGKDNKAGQLIQVLNSPKDLRKEEQDKVKANIGKVMKNLGFKNPSDPEQIRGAIVQLLRQDKYKDQNQTIIANLLKADLTKMTPGDPGDLALRMINNVRDGATPTLPVSSPTQTPSPVLTTNAAVDTNASGKGGNIDLDALTKRVAALEAENARLNLLLLAQGKGTQGTNTTTRIETQTVVPGPTNTTIKETNTIQPGNPTVIQPRDGKDGRDALPQAPSSGGNAPQQAPAEEGGRPGYEAKDIRDSQTDSHGSFKMARNVAIVCAILFILSGGAIGIFLLGALLGGAAAVYYDDKMQTEKQQIAKQWNIEQGLVDPGEYRQQQMEKQMSQGMRELQEQLAYLSKDNALLQQQFQDLFQQSTTVPPSPAVTTANPALADPTALAMHGNRSHPAPHSDPNLSSASGIGLGPISSQVASGISTLKHVTTGSPSSSSTVGSSSGSKSPPPPPASDLSSKTSSPVVPTSTSSTAVPTSTSSTVVSSSSPSTVSSSSTSSPVVSSSSPSDVVQGVDVLTSAIVENRNKSKLVASVSPQSSKTSLFAEIDSGREMTATERLKAIKQANESRKTSAKKEGGGGVHQ